MYPHWRSLLPQLDLSHKIMLGTFSYGFYRGMTAHYAPPYDLISERVFLSGLNGVLHLFPPYGLLRLAALVNRVEVAVTKKDPAHYPSIYKEVVGFGRNERVL